MEILGLEIGMEWGWRRLASKTRQRSIRGNNGGEEEIDRIDIKRLKNDKKMAYFL